MQARPISYLRCAAYLRPLPRTCQQQKQLVPQTHSRGRAMLAPITEISLPPCLGVFSNLFHLHDGTACHTCTHDIDKISTVLHAQLKKSCVPYGTYLRNTVPVFFHIHKVNQRAQHSGNLIIIYMCTWQAVTSCKWNKFKSNARETWCVILVSES